MSNDIEFVGWWNKTTSRIELEKPPTTDTDNWELVRVHIERIPEDSEAEKSIKKLNKSTKRLDKSIRNLVKSTRKWGKL